LENIEGRSLDFFNHVPLEDSIDPLDPVQHLSEHGVVAIEPRIVRDVHEELRAAATRRSGTAG
jgi:hypothetical protein